jgi:CubicO group peptidase (beta-lactamase class C family)
MHKILVAVLLVFVAGAAEVRSDQAPLLANEVSKSVAGLIEDGKLAGAVVLVAQSGQLLHLDAYGERFIASGTGMTTDTIFRIHSMTKAVVSAAALQLWEQGRYELEDPVAKYLPAFASMSVLNGDGQAIEAIEIMTVTDLFRHTSGLAYSFTAPKRLVDAYSGPRLWGGTLEQFCEELTKIPLTHEPGQSWVYGVNTDVLGRLIEVWSGQTLDVYLEENFFGPLQMKDTGFWLKGDDMFERFAVVHQSRQGGVVAGKDPLSQAYAKKPKMMSGGGGLVSTAKDYYQFLQMIADGGLRFERRFLKPETVNLMTTNQLPETVPQIFFGKEQRVAVGFGLGFSVVTGASEGWDKSAPVNEYGWGGAASCHYWVSPEHDNLIVITLEQTVPYNWNMERALKPVIYDALTQ